MPTLVMKFGGTSVGKAEAMAQTVQIIRKASGEWERLVVVTSALSGVTDALLKSASCAARGDTQTVYRTAEELRRLHFDVVEALVTGLAAKAQVCQEIEYLIGNFTNLCQAIAVLGEATPRALDAVASHGERLSVRVLAAALEAQGVAAQFVESTQLIITDRSFTAAHPDFDATAHRIHAVLEPILDSGRVPVVTGFLGATPDGMTTTLGRGGSDYSAAILGSLMSAGDVWIWTDVNGVMTADPRMVPEARTIPELSYREVAELAYYGAKVLHPKSIRPVVEAGIGLRVCNTFNPDGPDTRIVQDASARGNGQIKAVTTIRGVRLVTVEGRGMLGVPGVAARTFGAVAATGTSVPLITQASSEQSICFAVPSASVSQVIASLQDAFAIELANRDIDRIWASQELVIVTVVGAGMIHTPGIAGRIFSALGSENLNVIAIAQGSNEVSISLVVATTDAEPAVRCIHRLIVQ